uniref:Calcium-binding and coiled-coil domain-containing protein 2-like n=1 Tax=Diabrotica virgifera virgifera TaxID=50390 RepID=A0A6P7G2S6_DIAVI
MGEHSFESNFVSMKHSVQFLDIQDQYYCNADLLCTFKFNDYVPQEGDRVAIFKLGWSFVKDYILFEWAPVDTKSEDNIYTVTFNKHVLPKKNFDEIYQICYLSGENELHGASSPFQLSSEKPKPIEISTSVFTVEDSLYQSLSKHKVISTVHCDHEDEIKKLKEENQILKEALKVALAHNESPQSTSKNYDKDIADLKQITGELKSCLEMQRQEFDVLKTKITDSKEEYKKLYLEKYKIHKKYEHLKTKLEREAKPNNFRLEFDISDLDSMPPFPLSNSNDLNK